MADLIMHDRIADKAAESLYEIRRKAVRPYDKLFRDGAVLADITLFLGEKTRTRAFTEKLFKACGESDHPDDARAWAAGWVCHVIADENWGDFLSSKGWPRSQWNVGDLYHKYFADIYAIYYLKHKIMYGFNPFDRIHYYPIPLKKAYKDVTNNDLRDLEMKIRVRFSLTWLKRTYFELLLGRGKILTHRVSEILLSLIQDYGNFVDKSVNGTIFEVRRLYDNLGKIKFAEGHLKRTSGAFTGFKEGREVGARERSGKDGKIEEWVEKGVKPYYTGGGSCPFEYTRCDLNEQSISPAVWPSSAGGVSSKKWVSNDPRDCRIKINFWANAPRRTITVYYEIYIKRSDTLGQFSGELPPPNEALLKSIQDRIPAAKKKGIIEEPLLTDPMATAKEIEKKEMEIISDLVQSSRKTSSEMIDEKILDCEFSTDSGIGSDTAGLILKNENGFVDKSAHHSVRIEEAFDLVELLEFRKKMIECPKHPLMNASFEEKLAHWEKYGDAAIDEADGVVTIYRDSATNEWTGIYQSCIECRYGITYTLLVKYSSQGARGGVGLGNWGIGPYDTHKDQLFDNTDGKWKTASVGWTPKDFERTCQVTLFLCNDSKGTIEFDSVMILETRPIS